MATTVSRAPPPSSLPSGIEAHPIQFTGSGREYFRVWIVNVLLGIVTLGLYTPWARRRTAQYFYSHTQVAGSPLEFVAEQRRMVLGFLAFAGLYLAYQLAVETGQQLATSLLMFGFALLAPFLWASAMRFRLGATRWRGIRLAFTASWREVYTASWPVFAIAAVWTATFLAAAALSPAMPTGIAEQPGSVTRLPAWGGRTLALLGGGAVLTLLCVIRLEFNYRRLLVARTRVGGHGGHWKPRYRDFVRVWLATVGFFLLCALLVALAAVVLTGGSMALRPHLPGAAGGGVAGMIVLALVALLAGLLALVVASLPARAYRDARMFQLVWNNVGISHIARSKTRLRTAAYVWLRLKNLLLTWLTLGLYRPFAMVSEYAAKVESVTLYLKGGTDQLAGELVRQQGAFGDAAADVFGLDLIG
ncbi:YjgN family protein [Ottowia sp.]|uniref:YjgN family protein n=1 Tax=Ottowia sp. TaxID=1898956 RepID=UPI002B5133D6|nr:YjgN family protein [Ottowia sp.]HOB67644.1 YjgN family protein [Ottowia sp.]HPZ58269.1 YjgN family protein [Ottowia sp.]HQD49245.1 YjgN family protein [Ottowia sp.]